MVHGTDELWEECGLWKQAVIMCNTSAQQYWSVFKAICNTSIVLATPEVTAVVEVIVLVSFSTILRLHSERVKKDSLSTVSSRRQH